MLLSLLWCCCSAHLRKASLAVDVTCPLKGPYTSSASCTASPALMFSLASTSKATPHIGSSHSGPGNRASKRRHYYPRGLIVPLTTPTMWPCLSLTGHLRRTTAPAAAAIWKPDWIPDSTAPAAPRNSSGTCVA